ncbi:hypothetical protein ACHAXS_013671, partial [Conticribra weissflogii]
TLCIRSRNNQPSSTQFLQQRQCTHFDPSARLTVTPFPFPLLTYPFTGFPFWIKSGLIFLHSSMRISCKSGLSITPV